MHPGSQGRAEVYIYDVTSILYALEPILEQLLSNSDVRSHYTQEQLTDIYFGLTIHEFQIVSVYGFSQDQYPALITNVLRGAEQATQQLWRLMVLPPNTSGCYVLYRRIEATLWVFVVDPQTLEPIPTQH